MNWRARPIFSQVVNKRSAENQGDRMFARRSWGPVVPVAVAALLFPGITRAQEAAPDQEISLESLMDMVVTATLREQSTADAPASIEVVTASDIKARGYRTIKAIMNDVPGF